MSQTTRRDFLKLSTVGAFLAATGAGLAALSRKAWAEAKELVDMTKTKRKDPVNESAVNVFTGLGYVEDADKAEKAGKLKRTDKPHPAGGTFPAKSQYCSVCGLNEDQYVNTSGPGVCKLVPSVMVHNHGYCNSFNVHAKAKMPAAGKGKA